jgi:hypothetical protein
MLRHRPLLEVGDGAGLSGEIPEEGIVGWRGVHECVIAHNPAIALCDEEELLGRE